MMKNVILRKMISLMLSLFLTVVYFTFIPFNSYATETDNSIQLEESKELKIVKALNIIDSEMTAQTQVTRALLAHTVTGILNIRNIKGESNIFTDVSVSSAYANDILVLSQMGVLKGVGNGLYEPDKVVDTYAVATVMVRALGYDVFVDKSADYPIGYLSVANDIKILDEVSYSKEVDINTLAKIVYNTLDVKILEPKFKPSIELEISENTILDLHKIEKYEGIVNANSITGLYDSENVVPNGVMIGNEYFVTDDEKLLESIGSNVFVYYSYDEDDNRILYWDLKKTETIKIDIGDLDVTTDIFSEKKITYISEKGKTVTKRLDDSFTFIYNNVFSDVLSMELLVDKNGFITLIDNDMDDVFEVISAMVYEDYVVNTVIAKDGVISDKFGRFLNLNDENIDMLVISDINGNRIQLDSIYEWDVASVFDAGKYLKIIVSSSNIIGKVSKISKEDNKTLITIDGETYEQSSSYITNNRVSDITIDSHGTFYLNAFGKICAYAVDTMDKFDKGFAVLIKAYYDEFDEIVGYKLYTTQEQFISVEAAEKVKIDGYTKKEDGRYNYFISNGVTERQIIRYELNDEGKMSYIDTCIRGTKEDVNTLKRIWEFDDNKLAWRDGPSTFGRKINITDRTIKFSVPTKVDDYDAYGINFACQNSVDYSIEAYSLDNPFEPEVVVMKDALASDIIQANMLLVSNIYETYENDEIYTAVEVWGRNGKTVYLAKEDVTGIGDIEEGDIIAVSLNSNGIIKGMEHLYDYSENNLIYTSNSFKATNRVFSGRVYEVFGSRFSIATKNDDITEDRNSTSLENFNLDKYKAYVCENVRGKMIVEEAQSQDLRDYKTYGNDCSLIVGSDKNDWPEMLIIYK